MDPRPYQVVLSLPVQASLRRASAGDQASIQAKLATAARRMAALPPILRPPDLLGGDWIHLGIPAGALTAVCAVDASRATLTVLELLDRR